MDAEPGAVNLTERTPYQTHLIELVATAWQLGGVREVKACHPDWVTPERILGTKSDHVPDLIGSIRNPALQDCNHNHRLQVVCEVVEWERVGVMGAQLNRLEERWMLWESMLGVYGGRCYYAIPTETSDYDSGRALENRVRRLLNRWGLHRGTIWRI